MSNIKIRKVSDKASRFNYKSRVIGEGRIGYTERTHKYGNMGNL